jgi:hypothetical protein
MSSNPSSPRERFFIGVDLGQSNDPTAIAMVRRIRFERPGRDDEKPPTFQVGHLERVPLNTPYPAIIARTQWLLTHRTCAGNVDLAIDMTGVGRPVADLYRQYGIEFTGVVITGGNAETNPEPNIFHVPKLILISHLQALLHEGRLQIQKDLGEADTLVRELQDFRVRYSDSGHMTFNAREGKHDDLVLALAIAVWRATRPLSGPEAWLEHYRRLNEAAGSDVATRPEFGFKITSQQPKTFSFRVPGDITTLSLIDGSTLQVPADRIVEVTREDAAAYGRLGWEQVGI